MKCLMLIELSVGVIIFIIWWTSMIYDVMFQKHVLFYFYIVDKRAILHDKKINTTEILIVRN